MKHVLDGVYAAVVTPFDAGGKVLPYQLQHHMAHLARKGCDGILVCGTTGEAASLSVEERIALLAAAREAGTGLKILAGTGAASLEDAVRLTRSAFDLGVDAVVVIPPFFYRETAQEGLYLFYEALIHRAAPSDGKVLLYHNPVTTITSISFELITQLLERFPDHIVGIKDSGSDLEHSRKLNQQFPGLRVFVGDDRHVSGNLESAGAGAITGLSNIFPDLLVDVRKQVTEGKGAVAAQERLAHAHSLFAGMPRIPAFKVLLTAGRLITDAAVRPPLRPLNSAEMALLSERFHLEAQIPQSVDLAELVKPISD